MKRLRSIALAAAFVFALILPGEARGGNGPFIIGAELGMNLSDMRCLIKDRDAEKLAGSQGPRVGVTLDYVVLPWLNVRTGLAVSAMGAKDLSYYNNDYKAVYIEMPLNASFVFALNPQFSISADLGLYMALGTWGETGTIVRKEAFFGKQGVADRADFGPMAALRFIFGERISLGAACRYGIMDISNGRLQNKASLYNEALSISVGYLF